MSPNAVKRIFSKSAACTTAALSASQLAKLGSIKFLPPWRNKLSQYALAHPLNVDAAHMNMCSHKQCYTQNRYGDAIHRSLHKIAPLKVPFYS